MRGWVWWSKLRNGPRSFRHSKCSNFSMHCSSQCTRLSLSSCATNRLQETTDACVIDPYRCKNGGQCSNLPQGRFYCSCTVSFTGTTCETAKPTCQSASIASSGLTLSPQTPTYSAGARINVACISGYQLSPGSPQAILCQQDGHFSAHPRCIVVNVCSGCEHGVAATGTACATQGGTTCASCDTGRFLSNGACQRAPPVCLLLRARVPLCRALLCADANEV